MTRRTVRYTEQFFDRLDLLLPSDRAPDGRCSSGDFLLWDLPAITERLAMAFEASTIPLPERPETFAVITTGRPISSFALYAELLDDGSVEVFWLDVDLG